MKTALSTRLKCLFISFFLFVSFKGMSRNDSAILLSYEVEKKNGDYYLHCQVFTEDEIAYPSYFLFAEDGTLLDGYDTNGYLSSGQILCSFKIKKNQTSFEEIQKIHLMLGSGFENTMTLDKCRSQGFIRTAISERYLSNSLKIKSWEHSPSGLLTLKFEQPITYCQIKYKGYRSMNADVPLDKKDPTLKLILEADKELKSLESAPFLLEIQSSFFEKHNHIYLFFTSLKRRYSNK